MLDSVAEFMGTAYGALGSKHPTASLVAAMIVGALCFGALWLVGAQQYQHKKAPTIEPSAPVNNTSGAQSPIIQNNSGTVIINQPDVPKELRK